tara:strand:- start:3763 stop:20673 length:16911 start_codon:yes stop_codon:yes gene_type:complete
VANNIFASDPYTQQLDQEEAALTGRTIRRPGAATPPQAKNDGLATLEAFEDIAIRTKAPVNVLMAMAEAKGATDPTQALAIAEAAAQTMGRRMGEGASVEDIVAEQMGDSAASVLDRARKIDADIYGDLPKPNTQSTTVTGDIARQTSGSAISGVGSIIEGAGRVLEEAVFPTMGGKFIKDETGKTVGYDSNMSDGYLAKGATALADGVRGWGDALKDGVSAEAKEAMRASSPDGDLFKPSTWKMGDNPSAYGMAMLAGDVFGSFLPVVAASVATGGGGGLLIGGAQGAGAGAEQAREFVTKAAEDVGEDGVSALERESAFYREALARGLSKEEALEATLDAAETTSAMLTAPISAFGGALTGKILTGGATAIAKRGIVARTVGTAALSGVEEGLQEAAEGIATRYGTNSAIGTSQSLTDGTFGDFVLGALGGGPVGAVTGALDRPAVAEDNSDLTAEPLALPAPDAPLGTGPTGNGPAPTGPKPAGTASVGDMDPDQPLTPTQVSDLAIIRMAEIKAKGNGFTTADGTQVPRQLLTAADRAEYKFLADNQKNPAALAKYLELPFVAPAAPEGSLSGALENAAPSMFPDIGTNAPVELVNGDGEIFEGTFVGETATTINVRIGKDVIEVPREDFETGAAEMRGLTRDEQKAAEDGADAFDDLLDDADFLNNGPDPDTQATQNTPNVPGSGAFRTPPPEGLFEDVPAPQTQDVPDTPALPDIQLYTAPIEGAGRDAAGNPVKVSAQGPWDFETHFPSPDIGKLNGLLENGRGDVELRDPTQVAASLTETLPELLDYRLEAAEWEAVAQDIEAGQKPSFKGLKRDATPEEAVDIARANAQRAMNALDDMEGALRDVFADDAVDSMVQFVNDQASALETASQDNDLAKTADLPDAPELKEAVDAGAQPKPADRAEAPALQAEWWKNIARTRHAAKALGMDREKDNLPWTDRAGMIERIDAALGERGFSELASNTGSKPESQQAEKSDAPKVSDAGKTPEQINSALHTVLMGLEFGKMKAPAARAALAETGTPEPSDARVDELLKGAAFLGNTAQGPEFSMVGSNTEGYAKTGLAPYTNAELLWVKTKLIERGKLRNRGQWLVPTPEFEAELKAYGEARKAKKDDTPPDTPKGGLKDGAILPLAPGTAAPILDSIGGLITKAERDAARKAMPEGTLFTSQGFTFRAGEVAENADDGRYGLKVHHGRKDAKGEFKDGYLRGVFMRDGKLWQLTTAPAADGYELAAIELAKDEPDEKASKPESQKATRAPRVPKMEDFGEKIGGARKDKAARYRDELKAEKNIGSMPLSESFPHPDYAALEALGVSKEKLALIAVMRAKIERKPVVGWKVRDWATTQVQPAIDRTAALIDGAATFEGVFEAYTDGMGWRTPGHAALISGVAELPADMMAEAARAEIDVIDRGTSGVISSTSVGDGITPEYAVINMHGSKWRHRRETTRVADLDGIAPVLRGYIEAEAKRRAEEGANGGRTRKPVELKTWRKRGSKNHFIGFKVSDVVELIDGFTSFKEAREYLNENRESLLADAEDLRDGLNERGGPNRDRTGPAHRKGKATPKMFTDTFGFKGVEFGNWLDGKDRQQALNDAYDAFMDLAGILDVSPKTLSLDGELGLGFGSRGRGGRAMAHYEPSYVAINLTKTMGAGSLAHEWFHAVDNHFAKVDAEDSATTAAATGITKRGTRNEYATDRYRNSGALSNEEWAAFKELKRAMRSGDWYKRSAKADGARSKPYFATTIELAARGFEKIVVDRLEARGMVNDYLANIDQLGGAYPTTSELRRAGIGKAFDAVLDVISKRLGKDGGPVPKLPDPDPAKVNTGPQVGDKFETDEANFEVLRWDDKEDAFQIKRTIKETGKVKEYFLDAEMLEQDIERAAYSMTEEGRAETARKKAFSDKLAEKDKAAQAKRAEARAAWDEYLDVKKKSRNNANIARMTNTVGFSGDMWPTNPQEMIYHIVDERGGTIEGGGKSRKLVDKTGSFYKPSVLGSVVGVDFAQWLIDRRAAAEKLKSQQASNPTAAEIDKAAKEADPNPTDAQKEAENYKMGHIAWNGLNISLENAKGSERSGTGPDGTEWSVTMPAHYGRIKGTTGADGDHVDIYMGDHPDSDYVLVIDQVDAETGKFDEHKVMLGARARAEAQATYVAGFSDGKGAARIGGVKEMTVKDLKKWITHGDTASPVSAKLRADHDADLDHLFGKGKKDGAGEAEPKPASKPESQKAEPKAPKPLFEGKRADDTSKLTMEEQDRLAELRAKMRDKFKTQLNAGLDPEMVAIAAEMGGIYIKAGARRFRDLLRAMMDDLGISFAQAQPYARNAYNQVRDDMDLNGESIEGMDSAADVLAEVKALRTEIEKAATNDTLDATTEDADNDAGRNDPDNPEPLEGSREDGDQGLDASGTDGTGAGTGDVGRRGNAVTGGSRGGSSDGVGGRAEQHGPESASLSHSPAGARDGDRPITRQGESAGNYVIKPEFKLGGGTPSQKIKANIAAIQLAKKLEAENRFATAEEQDVLAAYVGWGGLRGAFDIKNEDSTNQFGRANAQLRELLTPEEYEQAFLSTRNAHYTAREVVDAMWSAMRHFGFKSGRVLEPTVGTGNFLGLQPADMAAGSDWYAAEMDPITGLIAKHLYPEAKIMDGTPFQKANFSDGVFDIAIGNPPFGSNTAKDAQRPDLDGMKIHNYVIAKSGLHLREGGVMAMVVTHRFLDTADTEGRAELAKRFKFLGAVRLPNDAFAANAGTEVTTDIVFLQKLRSDEKSDPKAAWLDTDGDLGGIRVNRYFQDHPTHIMGRSAMDGTMYGASKKGGEYTVHSDGRDLTKAIQSVIEDGFADLAGTLGDRETALEDAVSVSLSGSNLRIGGMTVRDGKLIRREMNDSHGNTAEVELTADTFWGDDGSAWNDMLQAVRAVRAETAKGGIPERGTANAVKEAASIATNAKGQKLPKPTKAQEGVYTVLDALAARDTFEWTGALDEALSHIEAATDRQRLGEARKARIEALLGLRELSLKQLDLERNDAPTRSMEANRKALNKAYDAFVDTYGLISDPANLNVMQGDIGLEMGLEAAYEPAVPAQKADPAAGLPAAPRRPATAKKNGMLLKRVSYPHRMIEKADNAEDALGVSLSERGRVDLPYMGKLVGKSTKDVIDELTTGDNPRLFFDPETDTYVDAEAYLSGNVKFKLAEAKARGLKANVAALESAQPEPMSQQRIAPSIRAQWIPTEVFEDFLGDLGVTGPKVNILASLGQVSISGNPSQSTDLSLQFRHPDRDVVQLFRAAMSGKSITIRRSDGTKSYVDDEATKSANALVARMGKVFEEWAYADEGRAAAVVDAFNEKMNTHRDRTYDGVKYLKTVGANPTINLRRTQRDGAWRMILSPSVLLDHVVGAGKTFTAITGVMERRRLGLSRKPMIVVPNHLVMQWASDFYALYPGANILAATPADFSAKNRKRMFARIASGDYDAVIVGHTSLGYIENDPEDVRNLLQEKKADLKSGLDEARRSGESKRTLTQIANRIEKYDEQLKALLERSRDDVGFDFTDMGVDYLVVDESQEFKNLEYSTAAERVVGMNDPQGSKKAFDLYVKVRGLRRRDGGVAFATGTPVSNSLVEVYTVMSYLAYDELTKRGLNSFDAWSSAYTQTETRMEYTATQKLKPRRVLASLTNLNSLGQLYRQFADTITMRTLKELYAEEKAGTGESTEFPVPKVSTGGRQFDSASLSPQQAVYMDYLVARMKAVETNAGKKEYMKVDNALWVLSDARKMSLDIRAVDPTADRDDNGKVARAAQRIKQTYDRWEADKGTQLVFSDLSTPSKRAEADAKKMINATAAKLLGATKGKAHVKSISGLSYTQQWRNLEGIFAQMQEDENVDGDTIDAIEEHYASLEDAEASMGTADVGFSVYDDLRTLLIESGIPAKEVAFIHDYDNPLKKQRLFQAVNRGEIRVLLGSSAKMGAGTNAQERLVALHHLDAPWRPSDVEQREGRIIRQGNVLYARDPEGFEVDIISYSTEGSSDTVLWQILERKSSGIEMFRQAGDMDTLSEGENDSDQYAEFMASSTGNPVFRYKLEAERLEVELRSEISGKLMARTSARRFMKEYPDRVDNLSDRITALGAAKVGTATYKGQKGDPAEYGKIFAAEQAKYEAEYSSWLDRKQVEESARDKLYAKGSTVEDATKFVRSKGLLAGPAPARPTPAQERILKASSYARVVNEVLTDAGKLAATQSLDFTVGNMELRIQRLDPMWTTEVDIGKYIISMKAGDRRLSVVESEGKNPASMPRLRDALLPGSLAEFVTEELAYRKSNLAEIDAQKPRQKQLSEMEIDQKPVKDAIKAREWYTLQVSIAENEADIERAGRSNTYIAMDTKRSLSKQSTATRAEPQRIDHEGEVYDTTGRAGRGSVEGLAVANAKVLDAVRQSDGASVLLIEGKERDESAPSIKAVIEEPAQAALNRTAQRRRSGNSVARRGNAIRDALYERLRAVGLDQKMTLRVVDTLTGQGKDGKAVPIEGSQAANIISVALDGDSPMFTLNHEVIHALRDNGLWGGEFGLFTEQEWRDLVRAARADKKAMAAALRDYPDLTAAQRIEEVIANQYAAWAQRQAAPTSQLAKLFRRIRGVIEAVKGAFNDHGLIRAGNVFAAIERGDIAARGLDLGLGATSGAVRYQRRAADALTSRILDAAVAATSGAGRAVRNAPASLRDSASYIKSRASKDGLSNALTDAMNAGDQGKYSILSLVPGRALFSEMATALPSARRYLRVKEEMDALRNKWHFQTDEIAQKWRRLIKDHPDANKKLMDLMHRSTIAGLDPAGKFVPNAKEWHIKTAQNPRMTAEHRAYAKGLLDEDNRRLGLHNTLRAEFEALPRGLRDMYREVRDQYKALADAHEEAVLQHIQKNAALAIKRAQAKYDKRMVEIDLQGLEGTEKAEAIKEAKDLLDSVKARGGWTKKAKVAGLRAQFEANRLKGPYFPLARFGDYFVLLRNEKGEVEAFNKFETQREQKAFIESAKGEGLTVQSGVLSNAEDLRGAVDPAFIADIEQLLGEAGADHKLMDDVWQRWLETLPMSSIRTNRIHRKARAGFNADAFRAFGKQMFHGSHQLARLTHAIDLDDSLEDMRTEATKAPDTNRAALVVNEMSRRHEFTMNPTSHSWATAASSLAFVWYLSVTPAAAAVNLTQTTVIGTPILATAFEKQGVKGAAAALGKALGDFTRGKGHALDSKRLTAGEKRALNAAYERGTVDKTQAHDLAGVAETGVEYSDFRARWMARISYFFHHAERMNREVTFLAAYRMARADGMAQPDAIDRAADLTWKIHFDYQNTSRPRLMQNDTAKVLLTFRNYTINVLWRLFRDSHQALSGATPKERKEARTQLLGITGSMALHAGITGTWGYGLIMTMAGLFFAGGDDEAEERLKALLVGEGEGFAGKVRQNLAGVALNGAIGHTLGISLSERIGMPNLWFRGSNRVLEGREWYEYMLGELVGPVPAIAEGMIHGTRTALDGNIMRGVESAVPKFARDVIKSGRYLNEGVTTYKGDPIIDEVSIYQAIIQVLGFTPSQIAERYETNGRMMNIQTQIQERRSDLQREIGTEVIAGRQIPEKLRAKLAEFNAEYPEYPITTRTLKQSIGGRMRASSRNEFGVQLNPKLNERIRRQVSRTIYD